MIIDPGSLFGVSVVAEGIERQDQLDAGGVARAGPPLPHARGALARHGVATGLRLPSLSTARTPTWTLSLLRFSIVAVVTLPTARLLVHWGSVESRQTTS